MGSSLKTAQFLIDSKLADAARGNAQACYDLGMVFSSGADGLDIDLIAAHKWFNIAAMNGSSRAQECRAEIAEDMSAREVAEAQKQARAWLQATTLRAA
jgi:TPR repeat protein